MKATNTLLGVFLLGAVGVGGYFVGTTRHGAVQAPGGESHGDHAKAGAVGTEKQRRILYYRNPMGLADTSPAPKKDPMGMDYIPVFEGEEAASSANGVPQVVFNSEKVQKLGVRTDIVEMRALGRVVRVAGRVEPDERRVTVISPKFEGYVERLHVNASGQMVVKGQPLFEVYSPDLVSAQREYAIATEGQQALGGADDAAKASMKQLSEATLTRLRNWDLSPEELKELSKKGDVRHALTMRSPVTGIVTEKKAFQGMRFMPGEMLYQVTDLSTVWVIADVPEQDISLIRIGTKASVMLNAYPGRPFEGRVSYVYPTLTSETRTVPVRIEMTNPRFELKPAMFAQVIFDIASDDKVLTVPDSAVIDSGKRQIVLVQLNEGRYQPREIKIGARGDNYIQVLEGLEPGEQVVVAANFLIDAESNLKAAIGGFGGHGHGGAKPKAEPQEQAPSTTPMSGHSGH